MRVVIDVGCAKYGGDESIPGLVEEFKPDQLYGFDPSTEDRIYELNGTVVHEFKQAAWLHDGTVGFSIASLGGKVNPHGVTTLCTDLAQFIWGLSGNEIILKMDAEGAEYELIPHLRKHGADTLLSIALIEWHCDACGYGIWDFDAPHPGGPCTASPVEWRRRREATESMLRCGIGGWNK